MLNRNEDLWPKSLKYNDKTFLFLMCLKRNGAQRKINKLVCSIKLYYIISTQKSTAQYHTQWKFTIQGWKVKPTQVPKAAAPLMTNSGFLQIDSCVKPLNFMAEDGDHGHGLHSLMLPLTHFFLFPFYLYVAFKHVQYVFMYCSGPDYMKLAFT